MENVLYLAHGDMFQVIAIASENGGWNIYVVRGPNQDLICSDLKIDTVTRLLDHDSEKRLTEAFRQDWLVKLPINQATLTRQLYAQTMALK